MIHLMALYALNAYKLKKITKEEVDEIKLKIDFYNIVSEVLFVMCEGIDVHTYVQLAYWNNLENDKYTVDNANINI